MLTDATNSIETRQIVQHWPVDAHEAELSKPAMSPMARDRTE
jgi:hypothetical protein